MVEIGLVNRVTTDNFVLAPVSATLPVAMFSLNLWGRVSSENRPIIAMFERPGTYDWNASPAQLLEHGSTHTTQA